MHTTKCVLFSVPFLFFHDHEREHDHGTEDYLHYTCSHPEDGFCAPVEDRKTEALHKLNESYYAPRILRSL